MEPLIIAVICASNIICFVIGAKVGQAVKNEKEIKMPNPVTAVKEAKAERIRVRENKELETMIQNVENYDGTGLGQKEIR